MAVEARVPMTPQPIKVRAEINGSLQVLTFNTPFKIGRTDDCEVSIKNEHVSRRHAEVAWDGARWVVRDMQSANGLFIDQQRVPSAVVETRLKVRLGILGPFVEFLVVPRSVQPVQPPQEDVPTIKAATHYFGNPDDVSIGDHTRMVRRAYAEVQKKQKRTYFGIIAGLVVCALAVGVYAFYLHKQTERNRELAEQMFYSMKVIDVNIANVEKMVAASGNAQGAEEVNRMRGQRKSLDDQYNRLLASLNIYDPKMTKEQTLILRVARIFGECEVAMPQQFVTEVQNYIKKWQSSSRYKNAVNLAKRMGYTRTIAEDFLSQGLPPQFFYLGLQESDFQEFAYGPPTRSGIAKGMWQFIPATGLKYGLKLGPLVDLPRADPLDDRHHWDRATRAAAAYIKDLYSTDAQASGLLVMACYNWGEGSVLPLVQSMPKNPRDRNFWRLLQQYPKKIPDETYQYVYYIFSAAVIGEDPKLFGMDFDNPLEGL